MHRRFLEETDWVVWECAYNSPHSSKVHVNCRVNLAWISVLG